jgi:hypothetical protein
MGLFGTLIGLDQQNHARNAVLASHLLEAAQPEQKSKIAAQVVRVVLQASRGYGEKEPRAILTSIGEYPRIVQMNFVALACGSMDWYPSVPGLFWERVRNPYAADNPTSTGYIPVVIDYIAKKNNVRITWPGNEARENLLSWV